MNGVETSRPFGWTGASAFAAAAVAGGLAVAAAIDFLGSSPGLGLLSICAAALVLVSIQRPEVGLSVLVALTFAHGFVVIKDSSGAPSAALPFAVLLVVFAFFSEDRRQPFLPRSAGPAVAAFAAYGAWLVASSLWAKDHDAALRAAGAYAKLMVMVIAVLALVRSPRMLTLGLRVVVGAGGVLAAMTVAQRFSADLTFYGFAKTPVHELTTTGEVERAAGPVGSPNAYAQLLVITVALAFGRLLVERRVALRLLAAAAIALGVAAVSFTFSRSGFVGLAVVLALSLFRFRPRLALVLSGTAVVLFAAGLGPGSYTSRVETLTQALPWRAEAESSDPSLTGRAAFVRAGFEMWRDHPLAGVGYANYPVNFAAYNRRIGSDPTLGDTPHNTPLEVLSETGVIGLALWSILVLAAFTCLRSVRSAAADRWPDARITADFLAISLVGYLVTALFLAGSSSRTVAWLLLALCFSAGGALESRTAPFMSSPRAAPSAR